MKKVFPSFLYVFVLAAFLCLPAGAEVFKSSDGRFSIDMPNAWRKASSNSGNSVLLLRNLSSIIEVKHLADCENETCLEDKMLEDLADVKAKKMKVVGNMFTGEEIKRMEFSTGEPLLYINFSKGSANFSSGYFMLNARAYSILTQNLSFAETDLIFSLISPLAQQPAPGQKVYGTYALPKVEVAAAPAPFGKPSDKKEALPPPTAEEEPAAPTPAQPPAVKISVFSKIKDGLVSNNYSLISKNMPPYIKQAGRLFDAFIALLLFYALYLLLALAAKTFVRGAAPDIQTNPASHYPLKFTRLYGTPSVIFQAKDNQGNTLISFNTRWGGTFVFFGLAGFILTCLALAAVSLAETSAVIALHSYAYNTFYSVCALLVPVTLFIFALGVIINLVSLREYTLYNKRGKKVIYVLQNGYGIKEENYTVYFADSKRQMFLKKKKFTPLREWVLYDNNKREIAAVKETSAVNSVFRRFLGHSWGMLRTDYIIAGRAKSEGVIKNHKTAYNNFTANINKPQAIDYLDLLVGALVINIRDKDKWHPWIN